MLNLGSIISEITAENIKEPTATFNVPSLIGILAAWENFSITSSISCCVKITGILFFSPALLTRMFFPGPGHSISKIAGSRT